LKGIFKGEEGHALGVGARQVTDREEHASCVPALREDDIERKVCPSLWKETGPSKKTSTEDKARGFISEFIKIKRFAPKQMREKRKSFANISLKHDFDLRQFQVCK
jgi:hypothetical protein